MKQNKPTATALVIGIVLSIVTLQLAYYPANGTEIWYEGDETRSHVVSPLPHTYLEEGSLPKSFDWGHLDGGKRSLLTHMLNQHIPQVCVCVCVCVCACLLFVFVFVFVFVQYIESLKYFICNPITSLLVQRPILGPNANSNSISTRLHPSFSFFFLFDPQTPIKISIAEPAGRTAACRRLPIALKLPGTEWGRTSIYRFNLYSTAVRLPGVAMAALPFEPMSSFTKIPLAFPTTPASPTSHVRRTPSVDSARTSIPRAVPKTSVAPVPILPIPQMVEPVMQSNIFPMPRYVTTRLWFGSVD